MFENKKLTESELASVAGGREFAAVGSVSFGETRTYGLAGVDVGRDIAHHPAESGKDKERPKDRMAIYIPV